jgi:hypothetical protein
MVDLGLSGGWSETGRTPENEIFRMGTDSDLHSVLLKKMAEIFLTIPERFRSALPLELSTKTYDWWR